MFFQTTKPMTSRGGRAVPTTYPSERQSAPDTSGYLSPSPAEHLELTYGPFCSTPKEGSVAPRVRRRVDVSLHAARSMLAIKPKINATAHANSPRVQRSFSDSEIHKIKRAEDNAWKRKPLIVFEDGLIAVPSASSVQCWKRRPYLTESTSFEDVKVMTQGCSNYDALSRHRVPDTETAECDVTKKLASQLTPCWTDSGVPVDESMTEFLANVDRENLAGFLNFYDRVTGVSAYDHVRRYPKTTVGTLV